MIGMGPGGEHVAGVLAGRGLRVLGLDNGLVAGADRSVPVGTTAMGPTGGEVLGALSVAVHAEVPLGALRSMIYACPAFHRGIEDALRALA